MSYTKETRITIYETTEYDKFHLLAINRPITGNAALMEVIRNDNLLRYNPIIVNSHLGVLDGQHRLEIAKELEVPIFYVIDHEHETTIVQKLNIASKTWTLIDHLHFFVSQGFEEYIFFKKMLKISSIIPSCLVRMFSTGSTSALSSLFKNGKLKFKYDYMKMETCVWCFNEINDKLKYYSSGRAASRHMQNSLVKLILRDEYSHSRFMKNIDKNPDEFIKANYYNNESNINAILLDKVYNKFYTKNKHINYN